MSKSDQNMKPVDKGAVQLIPQGNSDFFDYMRKELDKTKNPKKRYKAKADSFPNFKSGFFYSDGTDYMSGMDQSCSMP